MTGFIILGAVCTLIGLAVLTVAIRHQDEQRPRHAAMLLGGMMLTAFGLVIGGFAIAYNATDPLDLNAAEPAQ